MQIPPVPLFRNPGKFPFSRKNCQIVLNPNIVPPQSETITFLESLNTFPKYKILFKIFCFAVDNQGYHRKKCKFKFVNPKIFNLKHHCIFKDVKREETTL